MAKDNGKLQIKEVEKANMPGKPKNFQSQHNRIITNYIGPGPLLLEEFTNHIAGSLLPKIPGHLIEYQEKIRQKKSNASHFFLVLEETFQGARLSLRLERLLQRAFLSAKIDETQISSQFLEGIMDALDNLKVGFDKQSTDYIYLEKLISSIFKFYKLLK